MSRFEALYDRLPVAAQNAALSAYGYRLNLDRRRGTYATDSRRLVAAERAHPDALARAEGEQIRAAMIHAATHVPHYRRLFRDHGIDPATITSREELTRLPILEKETVREQGPDLVGQDVPGRSLRHYSSGGTTGTSVPFAVDTACLQLGYAIFHSYQWRWAGIEFGEPWVMINGRTIVPLDQSEPPFWRYNRAANEHFFSCFHVREDTMGAYLEHMRRIEPAMLHLYPSTAAALAGYLRDHGLTGMVRPRAIISTSETLYPETRALVEEQFGCRVHNHYIGDYAAQICECEHGGLHIAPEYGLVELIPIPDADVEGLCEMVLTSLSNRGTVLIRYRIGDTAVPEPDPCPCGRTLPRVRSLLGRTGDVLTTPEGNMINASNLTDVFKNTPAIRRCQFVQDTAGAVLARMEVSPGFGPRDQEDFVRELRRRVGPSMPIAIETVDQIPLTANGKFRFVISTI